MNRIVAACLFFVATISNSSAQSTDKWETPAVFKNLKYRCVGPSAGGRVAGAVGVPGDPLTYYAATASGGVWKSTDGGLTWKPIFDDQPISLDRLDRRRPVRPERGLRRHRRGQHPRQRRGGQRHLQVRPTPARPGSTSGSRSGRSARWSSTRRTPDIAFAAVLGHAVRPDKERGVYRTTDGGKTWKQVLYKDADTGASDVCFDPNNPRVVFAGLGRPAASRGR